MHQRRGLQGLPRRFAGHFVRGQPAQFLVNQREQFVRGLRVALLNGVKDAGDIAHE
jgi:hypothetical protein